LALFLEPYEYLSDTDDFQAYAFSDANGSSDNILFAIPQLEDNTDE